MPEDKALKEIRNQIDGITNELALLLILFDRLEKRFQAGSGKRSHYKDRTLKLRIIQGGDQRD